MSTTPSPQRIDLVSGRRWEVKKQTTPIRLIKNPLRHIACFPSLIGKVADNGSNTAFAQLPPKEIRKAKDWVHLVPKLRELTLSAHTINDEYLESFNLRLDCEGPWSSMRVSEEICQAANFGAFRNLTRLHIYFANLDNRDNLLYNFILQLPNLTHLRLSRPTTQYEPRYDLEGDTEYLADLSYTLESILEGNNWRQYRRKENRKLKSVILQLGSNFDRRVLYTMTNHLRMEKEDSRLKLIYTKANDSSHSIEYRYDQDVNSDSDSDSDTGSSDGYESDIPLAKVDLLSHCLKMRKLVERSKDYFFISNTKADTDAKCEKLAFYQFAKRAGGGEGVWARDCMTLW